VEWCRPSRARRGRSGISCRPPLVRRRRGRGRSAVTWWSQWFGGVPAVVVVSWRHRGRGGAVETRRSRPKELSAKTDRENRSSISLILTLASFETVAFKLRGRAFLVQLGSGTADWTAGVRWSVTSVALYFRRRSIFVQCRTQPEARSANRPSRILTDGLTGGHRCLMMRATAITTALWSGRAIAVRILPPRIGRNTERARFRAATLFSMALLAQKAFCVVHQSDITCGSQWMIQFDGLCQWRARRALRADPQCMNSACDKARRG